jgi:SP family general alpha glucoside:H+ symporter-like MFS transporter
LCPDWKLLCISYVTVIFVALVALLPYADQSAFPKASFQIKFGRYVGVTPATPSGYQLTAAWQSALGQANNASGFFAAILNGWLVPAYGQRRVVMWSLVLIIGGIFFPFFAPNLTVLTIGEVFLG